METITIEAGTVTQQDFEFKSKSAYVEGWITIDGQPAESAQVSLLSHSPAGARPQQIETTPEGYYRFDDVQAGDSTLSVGVTTEGGQEVVRNLRLEIYEEEAIQQDVDISLSPNRQITGMVWCDQTEGMNHGVAVFDDTVVLPQASEAMALMQYVNFALSIAECAEDGSFVLVGLEPGYYTVVAMEAPMRMQSPTEASFIITEVTLTGEEPASIDFDFR